MHIRILFMDIKPYFCGLRGLTGAAWRGGRRREGGALVAAHEREAGRETPSAPLFHGLAEVPPLGVEVGQLCGVHLAAGAVALGHLCVLQKHLCA